MAPRRRRRIPRQASASPVLAAWLGVAGACATAPTPAQTPPPASIPARPPPRPGWPDTWGIDFAFRCARAGDDLRFCSCLADEVQARWTPEELEAGGPPAVDEAARACHARLHGAE